MTKLINTVPAGLPHSLGVIGKCVPKEYVGIATGYILESRYLGIVRPEKQEPYEGEILLLACVQNEEQDLHALHTAGPLTSADDARRYEPGTLRYYLIILPAHGNNTLRPRGRTPVGRYYLATSPSFDSLDQAITAYHAAKP